MSSFSPNYPDVREQGFVHLVLLALGILILVGVFLLFNIRVTDHPSAKVEGIYIAEGGGSSDGDFPSSGGSGGGSQTSGSSSTGSTRDNSSGSGSSGSSNQTPSQLNSEDIQPSTSSNPTMTESGERGAVSGSLESENKGKSIDHSDLLITSPSAALKIEGEDNGQDISKLKSDEVAKEVENEVESDRVQDVKIISKDGELEVETITASVSGALLIEGEASSSGHHKGKTNKLTLSVRDSKGQDEVDIEGSGNETEITDQGVGANTTFPLSINPETKQLEVTTSNGVKPIRILPAQASQVAESAGVQNNIEKIKLVTNSVSDTTDSTSFQISGTRTGKLFGIIPVSASVETQVGAQSGELLEINQPLWMKLFSSFIN